MARNVVIKFDQPLTTTIPRSRELDEAPLFREPIPSLPPGKRIRVPFDTLPARRENGLPLAYDITLRYEGPTGSKYGEGEGYRLDMGIYEVVSTGPKGLPELVGEVEGLRKELHRWTDGLSGLRVHVVNEERRHRAEFRRLTVQRAVESTKEEGIVPAARRLTRDMWDRWLDRWGFR